MRRETNTRLAETTSNLEVEKARSDQLLYQMLPQEIAKALRQVRGRCLAAARASVATPRATPPQACGPAAVRSARASSGPASRWPSAGGSGASGGNAAQVLTSQGWLPRPG
jgi:hypothetical protein